MENKEITDLGCVAYLEMNDVYPIDMYGSNTRKTFVFEKTPNLDEMVDNYFRKLVLVEPIQFDSTKAQIKKRIYNA